MRDGRHSFAFIPACVVRVSACDLNDVDPKLPQETLELGDAFDLQAPATNPQSKRGETGMNWRDVRLRHVRLLDAAFWRSGLHRRQLGQAPGQDDKRQHREPYYFYGSRP